MHFEQSDLYPTETFYKSPSASAPVLSSSFNAALDRILGREDFKKFTIEPQVIKRLDRGSDRIIECCISIPSKIEINRFNGGSNVRITERMRVSSPNCEDSIHGIPRAEAITIYSLTRNAVGDNYHISGGCFCIEADGAKNNMRLLSPSELKTERIESIFDRIERSLVAEMID